MKLFKYLLSLFILCSLNARANDVNLVEFNSINQGYSLRASSYDPKTNQIMMHLVKEGEYGSIIDNIIKVFSLADSTEVLSRKISISGCLKNFSDGYAAFAVGDSTILLSIEDTEYKKTFPLRPIRIVDNKIAGVTRGYKLAIIDIATNELLNDSSLVIDNFGRAAVDISNDLLYLISMNDNNKYSLIDIKSKESHFLVENIIQLQESSLYYGVPVFAENSSAVVFAKANPLYDYSGFTLSFVVKWLGSDSYIFESNLMEIKATERFPKSISLTFSESGDSLYIIVGADVYLYAVPKYGDKKLISKRKLPPNMEDNRPASIIKLNEDGSFYYSLSYLPTVFKYDSDKGIANLVYGGFSAFKPNTLGTYGDMQFINNSDELWLDFDLYSYWESMNQVSVLWGVNNNEVLYFGSRAQKGDALCYSFRNALYIFSTDETSTWKKTEIPNTENSERYEIIPIPNSKKYLVYSTYPENVNKWFIFTPETEEFEELEEIETYAQSETEKLQLHGLSFDGSLIFFRLGNLLDLNKIIKYDIESQILSELPILTDRIDSYNRIIKKDNSQILTYQGSYVKMTNIQNSNSITLNKQFLQCAGFSHDDKYIFGLTGYPSAKLYVWDANTGMLIYQKTDENFYSMAISNISNTVAIRTDDKIKFFKFGDPAGVFDFYEETQSLKSIAVGSGETIELDADISLYLDLSYSLHNSIGEAIDYTNIIHKSGNSLEFTANNLPAGVYTISLRHGKNTKSIKVLITE